MYVPGMCVFREVGECFACLFVPVMRKEITRISIRGPMSFSHSTTSIFPVPGLPGWGNRQDQG